MFTVPTNDEDVLAKFNDFIALSNPSWTALPLNSKKRFLICSCHFAPADLRQPVGKSDGKGTFNRATWLRKPRAVPTVLHPTAHPPVTSSSDQPPVIEGSNQAPSSSTASTSFARDWSSSLSISPQSVVSIPSKTRRTAMLKNRIVQCRPDTGTASVQCTEDDAEFSPNLLSDPSPQKSKQDNAAVPVPVLSSTPNLKVKIILCGAAGA